jgi:uncharacterized membrane protein YgaE (UPF0421/DUF939 family)
MPWSRTDENKEIDDVFHDHVGDLHLGYREPSTVQDHILKTYTSIHQAQLMSDSLSHELRTQTCTIRELQQTKHDLALATAQLKIERERERRIKDHIANHIAEIRYKELQGFKRVKEGLERKRENEEVIEGLREDIRALCLGVGNERPDDVFEALAALRVV